MTLKGPYRRRDAAITPASNTRSVAVEAERHWWVSRLEILIRPIETDSFGTRGWLVSDSWVQAIRRIINERTR